MRLGVTIFATDQGMPPHELAVAVEERGFASLYLPEHTHIPVSRLTPAAATGAAGGTGAARLTGTSGDATLPVEYARTLDPFVALSMAAAVTSRIALGTGICLPAQREPIGTAKTIATLDHLSGGRFVFGIGYGWNVEEAASHGVDWPRRRELVRERVLAMRELWTRTEASFKGEYVELEPSWAWPKPARRIPVLIGGAPGPRLFGHIAEYGDGWIPIGGAGIRDALPQLRAAYEQAERDPGDALVIPFGVIPSPGKLGYYASLGIEEVVLRLPAGDRETVLPVLDSYLPYL